MTYSVSIVLVNYNTREITKQCLDSIFSHIGDNIKEVIVVDNASSDGSIEMLSLFPNIKFILNEANIGFARGVNKGIKSSSGDLILLLNSDIKIIDNSLCDMFQFAIDTPKCGIVGSRLINEDLTDQFSFDDGLSLSIFIREYILRPVLPKKILDRMNSKTIVKEDNAYWQVKRPRGACFLIKRELVNKIGLLDERFFMYCEEVDYCRRALKTDYKVYLYRKSQVVHLWAGTSKNDESKTYIEHLKSDFKYFRKYYTIFGNLLVIILFATNVILEIVTDPKFLLYSKEKRFEKKKKRLFEKLRRMKLNIVFLFNNLR